VNSEIGRDGFGGWTPLFSFKEEVREENFDIGR